MEREVAIGIKSVNIPFLFLLIYLSSNVVGAVEFDGLAVYTGDGCQTDSALPYRITRRGSAEFPSITFDLQPLPPPRNVYRSVHFAPYICFILSSD